METPQILERKFFDYVVRQNHKSQMFSATDLMNIYKDLNPRSGKTLMQYFATATTQDFLEELIQRDRVSAAEVVVTTKGRNGVTWVHPYIMIDLAMWLDASFKVKVLDWVYDNLTMFRDMAGDEFKDLTATIKEVLQPEKHWAYTNEVRLLQGLVGVDSGSRNTATPEQLKNLAALQNADIKLLKSGVIDYEKRKRKLIEFASML